MRVSRVWRAGNARAVLSPVLPQDLACAGNPRGPGPHLLRLVARLDYVKVDVDDDIVEIAWEGLTGRVSSH
jgi:hypothetical protein